MHTQPRLRLFFFSSRRRHTRLQGDWSSDVCSSDLELQREHGLALIFITHNLGIVARMCDRVAVMYAGRLVEIGPVRRIFDSPAHPYTRALLESIPRLADSRARLTAIDGQPPDLAALPTGCAFHPRCPKVEDRCRRGVPTDVTVAEDHRARCWLAAR